MGGNRSLGGGTRIVGWFADATVFAEFQAPIERKGRELPDGSVPHFLIRARTAVLLDRHERSFRIPRGKGGIGQSNVWYPEDEAATQVLRYIGVRGRNLVPSRARAAPKLQDVERRLRIERAAMNAATEWFVERGYDVEDVSMARCGWDLEAHRNRAHLKLEVKGTSLEPGEFIVEVTPNEYAKMTSKEHRADYRLCIVTNWSSPCQLTPNQAASC